MSAPVPESVEKSAVESSGNGCGARATFYSEQDEPSCTQKCRSVQHGLQVCSIATRGSDRGIISLWKRACENYAHVKDPLGRTALHIAASYGKLKVSRLGFPEDVHIY
jgi:hypothetical protein